MDESRKPNVRQRKENGASGEKTGNKEGAVDDEEGTESTDINGKEKGVEEKLFREYDGNGKCIDKEKSEDKEKRNAEVKEGAISEAEIDNDIKRMKEENKKGKGDEGERFVNEDCKNESVKEVTEKEVFENAIGNDISRELLQVSDGKAKRTKVEMTIDENKVGLNNLPTEFLPSEKESIQIETVDHTASINNQDSICKEDCCRNTEAGNEVMKVSENTACGQSKNQVTAWKEIVISEQGKKTTEVPKNVEHPGEERDKIQKQLVTDSGNHDKDKQKEDLKVSEIMNKEQEEKDIFTEVKDEKPDREHDIMKQENKMGDGGAVNRMQDVVDVEGSVNVSLVSSEVFNVLQKKAKEREELSFIGMTEGQMGMITATQGKICEDGAQEMSSSKVTIKNSVQTERAAGKQEDQKTYEKEENEADSKANNENEMKGFSVAETGNRDERQQNEPNGDIGVLDLNHKATSFMKRGTPELSVQKSVEEVMERSESKQTCESQEADAKLNEEHITRNIKTPASEMALPQEESHETDKSRDILDTSVTEKPICTAFQGTVISGAKCEESIQRSEVKHSSQNQENSKIKDGNSLSTETAINGQLKQFEYAFQQTAQEKPAPLKPQTMRQQTQQKQQRQEQQTQLQNQTQKQQQEQNEMERKKQQEERTAAKQDEQQQQQQKKQNICKKEEKKQAEQKQIQQTQQPLKQKIQMNEKHEEKQCIQQKQQHSLIEEQPEICKQKAAEHIKQRQLQTKGNLQQNQQEQKTKKQLQEELKQENEQEWQQEKKCKQQHMQSHKQEKERESMEKSKQEHQQKQQSKWPQQEQQEPKQMTQKSEEEKQKEQKQPDQGLLQQEQHRKQHSEEGEDDSAPGCGGTQGRSCPIYFGVKSYLHQFYDSAPVKDSQLYEDYTEEDDFEYTVDPVKHRGCRKCCRGFWFRAGLWGGINLMLVGVITLLVGYLTPQREMIVGHHNNLEILDRTAIAFNHRLELCRLAGLAVFCCGGLVLLITLMLSTFLHIGGHNNNNGHCCIDNAYYGYVTTSLVEPFIAGHVQGSPVSAAAGVKIPVTEQIKSVQPTLWPDIATVKDGALVPNMP